MNYQGSCHCGAIGFEVEGEMDQVMECNCSHCSRKGFLLWFVPRGQFKFTNGENAASTYLFNKHVIEHRFCPTCGCQPFGFGKDRSGAEVVAVNTRCLEGIDLSALKKLQIDGKHM